MLSKQALYNFPSLDAFHNFHPAFRVHIPDFSSFFSVSCLIFDLFLNFCEFVRCSTIWANTSGKRRGEGDGRWKIPGASTQPSHKYFLPFLSSTDFPLIYLQMRNLLFMFLFLFTLYSHHDFGKQCAQHFEGVSVAHATFTPPPLPPPNTPIHRRCEHVFFLASPSVWQPPTIPQLGNFSLFCSALSLGFTALRLLSQLPSLFLCSSLFHRHSLYTQ